MVIVHPWFCAVSLGRYYTGPAELTTLPPLTDYKLQRLDLLKQQMTDETALQPVLARMEHTLRSGGTIWLVGHYPFANPPQPPPTLPRAGEGPEGWRAAPYILAYAMAATYFLQSRALRSEWVEIPADQPVHPFEDLAVRTISGWRSGRHHGDLYQREAFRCTAEGARDPAKLNADRLRADCVGPGPRSRRNCGVGHDLIVPSSTAQVSKRLCIGFSNASGTNKRGSGRTRCLSGLTATAS